MLCYYSFRGTLRKMTILLHYLYCRAASRKSFRQRTLLVILSKTKGPNHKATQLIIRPNCQYRRSNLYCDITLYLATKIDLQLQSILDRPLDTLGACVIVKDQSSNLVYLNVCIK